ncbi:MAG: helix-turn-helix domain-containing protein [Firmicutes bacterium]|nr:helix-turn-helix domain-containing protein [Bacillota bacterium]
MNKAFRYRLDPHAEQEILIHKTLGCVRFVYNRMLANHQAIYDGCKNDKATWKQPKYLLPADLKKECAWLKDVDSVALANVERNVQTAYRNFFRDPSVGFPQFQSQHHDKKSQTTNNQGAVRFG